MDRWREYNLAALAAMLVESQDHCLSQRGCAVVVRGIRDFHTSQVTHQALVFIDSLKRSLGDFRLVRGVRGIKLIPPKGVVDHRGDEVVVRARAEKTGDMLDF